jgi:hypothetical protein
MSGVSKHGVPVGGASGASVGSKSGGSKGGKGGHAKHWLVAWRTRGPTGTSGDLIAAGGPRVAGGGGVPVCALCHPFQPEQRGGACRVWGVQGALFDGRIMFGQVGLGCAWNSRGTKSGHR